MSDPWGTLSSDQRAAILGAVDELFEDLVDDLVREASASGDADAEEVVGNVLSDLVASIEEQSDELGFDPYDDDELDLSSAIHAHYYETLLPRKLPPELLGRLDRYR